MENVKKLEGFLFFSIFLIFLICLENQKIKKLSSGLGAGWSLELGAWRARLAARLSQTGLL